MQFESLILCQKIPNHFRGWGFFIIGWDSKRTAERSEVKNMPGACFLGRGKIHILMNAPSMGVGMGILFVAVISNSIYSVQQTHKKDHILMDVVLFYMARRRNLKDKFNCPVDS